MECTSVGVGEIGFVVVVLLLSVRALVGGSCVGARLDVVKHSPAVFLLAARQSRHPIGL